MTTKVARREFLQLANKYVPGKSKVAGYYLSEKLDGTRCLWDGGLSRGLPTVEVPWASVIDPKTGKRKKKIKPVATGLWSRYGNPIIAPDWFLNLLPCMPLDGELWAGRQQFQLNRSIVAGNTPDPRFDQIQFAVFGTPSLAGLFQDGEIKNAHFHCHINSDSIQTWVENHAHEDYVEAASKATFDDEMLLLREYLDVDRVYLHPQTKLPTDETAARAQVEHQLYQIIESGGEGIVLRDPTAIWTPKRTSSLLKYKPYTDDEGTLVGFTSGDVTDKGSKHRGKIGALIVAYQGKLLKVSGLTDEEREFASYNDTNFAYEHPDQDMPPDVKASRHFKVGQQITFKYRELTDAGIPKEANYLRVRDEE